MKINRAVLIEFPLFAVVLEAAAAMLLALAILAIIAAVVIYRSGDVMMAVPVSFAIGDHLSLPYELTTLVSILKDGAVPTPSL